MPPSTDRERVLKAYWQKCYDEACRPLTRKCEVCDYELIIGGPSDAPNGLCLGCHDQFNAWPKEVASHD
jgi:hypothetical protein